MYVGAAKIIARSTVRVLALTLAYSMTSFRDIDALALARSVEAMWPYLVVFALTGAVFDTVTASWRKSWRFTSLRDVIVMARSATLIALALLLVVFILDRGEDLPRSTLLLAWILDIGAFGGLLMLRRALHERSLGDAIAPFLGKGGTARRPLMLIGPLDAADAFIRELNRESSPAYGVVGLVSPNSSDVRREVRDVRVVAGYEGVAPVLECFAGEGGEPAVLFLDGALAPSDLPGGLLAHLRKRGVHLLRQNRVTDLDVAVGGLSLRELDFNELLSRSPVTLDFERVKRLVAGRRVVVTGAGGSIGSEICRQVAALSCGHLAMIDNSEFGLFRIDQEIGDAFSTLSKNARLVDIRDAARIRKAICDERPDIVFHAAALKHVPLMEAHPADSVLTNVIGSGNVADAAIAAGAANFVFISTDKAVDPPNVMGATKRLAERVVCQKRRRDGPRMNVVRFGNVLGSAGSVVPTFMAQIARGGPVTLTHPDIERYFMTIPEAVQLVLHATAKSAFDDVEGVLVLDMGEPVKIIDLARRLIELHGKTPGSEVEIRVTGLRPGEKLSELLVDVTETARPCDPGVLEVVDANAGVTLPQATLRRLEQIARDGDDDAARAMVFDALKTLRSPPAGRSKTLRVVD